MTHFTLPAWEEQQRIDNQSSGSLKIVHPEQPRVRSVWSQQFPDFFAPELFCQSHDIAESKNICEAHFNYSHREISVAQISMDKQFVLSVDGQQYHMTEKAHNDLCKILRIPINFAHDVPMDLISTIVERLKSDHQQSVIIVARGGIIVALVDTLRWATRRGEGRTKKRPHYTPVTNLSLLRTLEKVWSDADVDIRIIISDIGLQVQILGKAEAFIVEPVVGDPIRVGVSIASSETGGSWPLGKGYALRLACSNGNVVQTDAKLYRFSADHRCSLAWRLNKFATALQSLMQEMQARCGVLRTAYRRMVEQDLDDVQFHRWFRQALYVYRGLANSSEHIDRIFGVAADDRQKFFKRVRDRQSLIRAGTTAVHEPPEPTGLIVWDLYNRITAAARDEICYPRRLGLENLAGDVMNAFLPLALQ
jgi:hypothetical protein